MISSDDILRGKILIVDDLEVNIKLLERMLGSAGYVSITATMNPREVCALHLKNRYDLILLDLEMPAMDGFQVMEALKEIEPQDLVFELGQEHRFQVQEGLEEVEPGGYLPVIVITAQPAHKLRALQAGAKDFINKPFDLAEVLARVRSMLEVRLLHLESKRYIKALEVKVEEVEVSHGLLHRQSEEIKRLREKIMSLKGDDALTLTQPLLSRAASLHTLLYVVGNPANLLIVEQFLECRPDIRLLSALNADSGIKIANFSRPDVILMDINLPGINGFEALEILRDESTMAHIPVIAVSANAMPFDIEQALQAGFFRNISKPIMVDEFMKTLDLALEFAGEKSAQRT
jgi:adenylate cyclase